MTALYEPDARPGESPALTTHESLMEIVRKLKSHPDITRAQFTEMAFERQAGRRKPSPVDQDRAVNLAVRVMVMINCSGKPRSSSLLEHGAHHIRWRGDVTFSQFIEGVFPAIDHPGLNDYDIGSSLDMRTALTANKLKKRAGLKFRPTDDLSNHLKFDRRTGVVDIYHHTAFLKEYLRLTKSKGKLTISDTLKL
jgi:hypothetical protein